MHLNVKDLSGSDVLAGAGPGRALAAKLIEQLVPDTGRPQLCFVDVGRVRMMSASYAREGLFGFRDWVRKQRPDIYPVIANANSDILEEIVIIAEARGAVLTCTLDEAGHGHDFAPVGKLDAKARLTFELVAELGDVGVSDLVKRDDEQTKPTAWSNRLAGLVELGLVMETQAGRAKRYRPVWEH
jgi:hypothetical protein